MPVRLLARSIIEAFCVQKHVLSPAGCQQIGLLPEIEVGVLRPLRIVKAIVGRFRHDQWLDFIAQEASG